MRHQCHLPCASIVGQEIENTLQGKMCDICQHAYIPFNTQYGFLKLSSLIKVNVISRQRKRVYFDFIIGRIANHAIFRFDENITIMTLSYADNKISTFGIAAQILKVFRPFRRPQSRVHYKSKVLLHWSGFVYSNVISYRAVTWRKAQSHCMSWGGRIVDIHSNMEDDFLFDKFVVPLRLPSIYVDSWYHGAPASFAHWNRGIGRNIHFKHVFQSDLQPNKLLNCTALVHFGERAYHSTWLRIPCNSPYYSMWICKRQKRSLSNTNNDYDRQINFNVYCKHGYFIYKEFCYKIMLMDNVVLNEKVSPLHEVDTISYLQNITRVLRFKGSLIIGHNVNNSTGIIKFYKNMLFQRANPEENEFSSNVTFSDVPVFLQVPINRHYRCGPNQQQCVLCGWCALFQPNILPKGLSP